MPKTDIKSPTHALVIFDLDGVLIDSEIINAEVTADCLQKIGWDVKSDEVIERFVGLSSNDIIISLKAMDSLVVPDDFLAIMRKRVLERLELELKEVEGTARALSSIPNPRCVASSSSIHRITRCLLTVKLLDQFGANLFSSELVQHGKPAPDLFLYASQSLQFPPTECIVVEDSVRGILAAKAAQMKVVAFLGATHARSSRYQKTILDAAPDLVCLSMRELPRVLACAESLSKP
jgi:HAD superfamily hydrolase (TIGR01509 family)